MKRSDQIFTLWRVNAGLTADRAVDLCQKRCWNLNKLNTSAQNSRGKPDQIPNHTAAERNNDVIAFDLLIQQPFDGLAQNLPVFCLLACRKCQGHHFDIGRQQPFAQRFQMQIGHGAIGDNSHPLSAQERRYMCTGFGQKTGPNVDIIAAGFQINLDGFHHGTFSKISDCSTRQARTRPAI